MALLVEALPEACMTGTFRSHGGVALAVTVVGLLAAAFSLMKGFQWLHEELAAERAGHAAPLRHPARGWILGAWVLAPPAWLYCEDIFLFRMYGKAECFASFAYAQQIVTHGWIVLVAVLTLLYFGRVVFSRR